VYAESSILSVICHSLLLLVIDILLQVILKFRANTHPKMKGYITDLICHGKILDLGFSDDKLKGKQINVIECILKDMYQRKQSISPHW